MSRDIRIGQLRYRVKLMQVSAVPSPTSPNQEDTFLEIATVYADVVPVGTQTWLAGQIAGTQYQTEFDAITHRITIRYHPGLDRFSYVSRERIRPDGVPTIERYRVHRTERWEGRDRFLIIDAEQVFEKEDL